MIGKTVLVTGANRGIGRAFVDEALARGATRVYGAVRTPESLAAAHHHYGDRLVAVPFDLTDSSTITDLATQCRDVDLLISNAAGTISGAALDAADADVRALFEMNVFAPLELFRRFAPVLAGRGGSALLGSSVAALLISRSAPIYSATKAAATMTMLGIAAQLRTQGVRVSITYPGFVDTDMTTRMEIAKAPARSVAARSLDGCEAGELAIFPDRYAEIIRETLHTEMSMILADPHEAASAAVRRFRHDPQTGQ